LSKASLRLVELQRSTQTDTAGMYGFVALAKGKYQMKVSALVIALK
jgi:hypothetical protein